MSCMKMGFEKVAEFENIIANYFGSPFGVATDSCTHALEICLRYEGYSYITVPTRTYISVPFLPKKIGIEFSWKEDNWENYYYLGNTNIIDAAVYWKKSGYIPGTYMCISFQYNKHLSLGRGGIILTDNELAYVEMKKMSYDGRLPNIPWGDQDINTVGYHYYMTPETAFLGIKKFNKVVNINPKIWSYKNYPYLPNMQVFK